MTKGELWECLLWKRWIRRLVLIPGRKWGGKGFTSFFDRIREKNYEERIYTSDLTTIAFLKRTRLLCMRKIFQKSSNWKLPSSMGTQGMVTKKRRRSFLQSTFIEIRGTLLRLKLSLPLPFPNTRCRKILFLIPSIVHRTTSTSHDSWNGSMHNCPFMFYSSSLTPLMLTSSVSKTSSPSGELRG